MTLATFIQKFPGAKRSGDQYIVRCPAHEDRSPSLSIGEGDHGQVLIHCHAGCAPSDVLAKVGLSLIDLFPRDFISRAQKAGARPVPNLSWKPAPPTIADTPPATYDYCDEAGKLLFQVMRLAPKGFRQRVPRPGGGWEYALGDVRRVVYRLPELVGNDTIFIAEGEKDADKLAALRFAATTNSGGAKKWTDDHTAQLVAAGAKKVVIFPDNDDVGREHAAVVASSCRAAGLKVKVVTLPGVPEHGDVSDYLASHDRADLVSLISQAPEFTDALNTKAISTVNTNEITNAVAGEPILTRLSDVEPEEIDWIWRGRLARGKFTQIAGNPGEGKSRLTLDVASRITTGAAWPDGGTAPLGNVLFVIAEDGIADTVRPAIDAMGGDSSRVYIWEGVAEDAGVRAVNLARDLAALEQAIEQVKPQLVVIDPITAFLGKTDSYKDAEVRSLLAPILALIARHRTALIAVAHLSKDAQKAALYRPGGSIAFVAAARFGFVVGVHPEQAGVRVLARTKNNIGQPAPSLAYRIQQPDGHITWDGEVAMDAEMLLSPKRGRGAPKHEAASEFLQRLLDAGPMESSEVYRAAATEGHALPTIRRAIRELGIRSRKIGGKAHGQWVLALPTHQDQREPEAGVEPLTHVAQLPVRIAFADDETDPGSGAAAAGQQELDEMIGDDEWEA